MLELLNKLKEFQEKIDALDNIKKEIEQEFSRRLGGTKDWELIIIGILSGNRDISYNYGPSELLENLIPEVKNIRFHGHGMMSFDIRIIGEVEFPKTWISTGVFNISMLESKKLINPEFFKAAETRKRVRISEYQEEIEELQRLIETEERELASIRTWIDTNE